MMEELKTVNTVLASAIQAALPTWADSKSRDFKRTYVKSRERETELESATSSLGSNKLAVVSIADKGLTSTPSPVCTRVCTSEPENDNAGTPDRDQGEGEGNDQGDRLDKLATALLTLSPADRQRLAAMLARHQDERTS